MQIIGKDKIKKRLIIKIKLRISNEKVILIDKINSYIINMYYIFMLFKVYISFINIMANKFS